MFNKKSTFLITIGALLLFFSLLAFFHTPNRRFEKICDDLFIKELSEDGLSLHYTLADPDSYHINVSAPSLPVFNATLSQADYNTMVASLEALQKIDRNSLNAANQRTYDILLQYLQLEKEAYAYLYYDEPLSPTSGMQCQLLILLSEYTFREKADIEQYLYLLQSIPAYMEGLVSFEKEKAARGLFMSDSACRDTIAQCNQTICAEDLNCGKHFMQITFQERVNDLVSVDLLSDAEASVYIEANNTILKETVLPAYKSLAHNLTALLGSGCNDMGLCYYPEGKEYYELLVARQTGSSKDMEETMQSVKTAFLRDYDAFTEAVMNVDVSFLEDENAFVFSMSEPDKMLAYLEDCILQDFPIFPGVDVGDMYGSFPQAGDNISSDASFPLVENATNIPTYEINAVDASLEKYVSPAFYLTPPMDDVSENVIYINYAHTPDNLELFTTLAHEGYPGHLYQAVYTTLAWEEQGMHPLRHLLHFGGYVEGYATYAELYSYEYAHEFGDANYCNFIALNRKLHLALYSMLDISIHYYGATYEEAHESLAAFGIDDPKITREIYDYIVNSPGNYLKYYVGYLEIMECRELAKLKWKDDYSDYAFHEFLLEFGPADFEMIRDGIREYKVPRDSRPLLSLQCDWFQGGLLPRQEILLHRQWT